MGRAGNVLRQGRLFHDSGLLKVLQSEINHELYTNPWKNDESGSLGDFAVKWDSPNSKDVMLLRKSELGDEVAVSSLLGPERFEEDGKYPREVRMKVSIRKPGMASILQFDCGAYSMGVNKSTFDIYSAHYIPSLSSLESSVYRGPPFSSLDLQLQAEFKKYLVGRGIGEHLTNFLLQHMHKREQSQYVSWLQKLESMIVQTE